MQLFVPWSVRRVPLALLAALVVVLAAPAAASALTLPPVPGTPTVPTPPTPPTTPPAPPCGAVADVTPASSTLARGAAATLCLVNVERRRRGLRPLRADLRLARAARAFARRMVARDFFRHEAPGERSFTEHVLPFGFTRGARRWRLGENLAWGSGEAGTPRDTVRRWMDSPPHRANILKPGFTSAGAGVASGAPVRRRLASRAATYVMEFGARR